MIDLEADTHKSKCSDRLWINLSLISETLFALADIFLFYVCLFAESILKSKHSG